MLDYYLVDPDTDVYQTEQPQISYSVDFKAEQSSAMAIGYWLLLLPIAIASGVRRVSLTNKLRLTCSRSSEDICASYHDDVV